ncbi:hypothetical protein POM88_014008 [Heracleum sosnowskyi]|uniref:Uncharacterized protein n=1 Tax=Heracleum sosnowskyi TaxID=360622 RepID=A0AAD8HU06_9APIA|nr:hypothetical protein POM88_029056 [Heracleum sosnowskyi]KAK1383331.1 hypothetical protein POM88_021066 [Heracleum sosnowskyi]KAK1394952.1 hypothetical protein POM88_014008 [Heracleum sosnowskyi]
MKHIATPVQSRGKFGTARDAMILLKHKILKSILLRLTKKGRSAELALPPKMVIIILSYAARHQKFHIYFSMHKVVIMILSYFLRLVYGVVMDIIDKEHDMNDKYDTVNG